MLDTHINPDTESKERPDPEAALRVSEECLRQAMLVAGLGLFEHDHLTETLYWSPRLREIYGFSGDEAATLAKFLGLIHPEDHKAVNAALQLAHGAQGLGLFAVQHRIVRRDGGVRWLTVRARTWFGGEADARRPIRTIGAVADITERKLAETELEALNRELDRKVAERTRELADARQRLRGLLSQLARSEERERHRLAGELHDYLAQALTAARMNLSVLGNKHGVGNGQENLHEAQQLIDVAIDYTRTLMAALSPRVLYDLGLAAGLRWLGEQMARHQLTVQVEWEPSEIKLEEETASLAFQCARELLWNVVKHAKTDHAVITVSFADGTLAVSISDSGCGFDPVLMSGHSGGREKFGLFSIQERLESQGGSLIVESAPGMGTRVLMRVPVEQPSAGLAATLPVARAASASPGDRVDRRVRVVLVDDHDVVRQGLRHILDDHGDLEIVGEAKDGAEALTVARRLRPDVMVMDVNMPGVNGIEATRSIVRELPSTIVVGLSFLSDDHVVQAMQAAGARTCVNKARAAEEIYGAINDAVRAS